MEVDVQVGAPYDEHYYNPGSSYFQGATGNEVVYEVQTAPAQNTDIRAEQFTLLKDI